MRLPQKFNIYEKFQSIADIKTSFGTLKISRERAYKYFSFLISLSFTQRDLETELSTTKEINLIQFQDLLESLAKRVYPAQPPRVAYENFLLLLSKRPHIISRIPESTQAPNQSFITRNQLGRLSLVPLLGIPLLLISGEKSTDLENSPANSFLKVYPNTTAAAKDRNNELANKLSMEASTKFFSQPIQLVSSQDQSELQDLTQQYQDTSFFAPSYEFMEEQETVRERLEKEVLKTERLWRDAGRPTNEQVYKNYERALDEFILFIENELAKKDQGKQLSEPQRLLNEVLRKRKLLELNENPEEIPRLEKQVIAAETAYIKSVSFVRGAMNNLFPSDGSPFIDGILRDITREKWIRAGFPVGKFDSLKQLKYKTSLKEAYSQSLRS